MYEELGVVSPVVKVQVIRLQPVELAVLAVEQDESLAPSSALPISKVEIEVVAVFT
jgi:hypothetical protein